MPSLYYNLSQNVTGIVPLFQEANTVSGGIVGTAIPIMIFVICFAAFIGFGKKTAFASSSFITLVVSTLLMTLQLVNTFVVFGLILVTAGAIILLYFTKD